MFDALVETEVLAAHLDDPEWVVCDCRSVLSDTEAGPKRYAESHIPSARFLHLERDLSGPLSPDTGRHPLPDPAKLAVLFGRIGIGDGVQVVAYDDAGGAYAARLWWLLRWLGHREVAVLNGGWQQWLKEERPVTAALPAERTREFHAHGPDREAWFTTGEVLEMVRGRKHGLLLDAHHLQH